MQPRMRRRPWLALVLLAFAAGAPAAPPPIEIRLKHGDDPRWADPAWDDRDWQAIGPADFPARAGVYWARIHLARGREDPRLPMLGLPPSARGKTSYGLTWPQDEPVDAIFLAAVFSFELFWDGRLLARSGVVGSSPQEEVPGRLDHLVRIPDTLLGPGEHVLALRMSSHHYNFAATRFGLGATLADFRERLAFETRRPIVPLVCLVSSLLMAAISEVLHRFVDRRRTLRLCGALGLALAVFYGLIAFRWLYNAPYDWHCPRLTLITATLSVVGVLLPWLLVEQFGAPRRGWWLAASLPLVGAGWLASHVFEVKALWICRASLVLALAIAGWAAWRRRRGAWLVIAGVLVGVFAVQTTGRVFLDPTFFLIFEGLVLFVFAMVGVQVQADRSRTRAAELTAARLELELLKKNIQPHFLLNTLASIIEVIEQEPRAAVALVEGLAAEFRILAAVAGEKLIPVARELELCRAHLRVMSLRRGLRCSLVTDRVDEGAPVPPAIFHTLIENGLTHLAPRDGELRFELSETRTPAGRRYRLLAAGQRAGDPFAGPGGESGTGTRYLRARLEESFTGRWGLTAGPCDAGWCTEILIQEPAAAGRPVTGSEAGRAAVIPEAAK